MIQWANNRGDTFQFYPISELVFYCDWQYGLNDSSEFPSEENGRRIYWLLETLDGRLQQIRSDFTDIRQVQDFGLSAGDITVFDLAKLALTGSLDDLLKELGLQGPQLIVQLRKPISEKPSERIRFSLQALIEAEQPGSLIIPDMGWYFNREGDRVRACLGGIAAIKKWNIDLAISGEALEQLPNWKEIFRYMDILDSFRIGWISLAFRQLGLSDKEVIPLDDEYIAYSRYCRERNELKTFLQKLANKLEAIGY